MLKKVAQIPDFQTEDFGIFLTKSLKAEGFFFASDGEFVGRIVKYMTFFDDDNQIGCREAQLLMSAYIEDDASLTQEERDAFEAHLRFCSDCQQEYEEDKQLIALAKEHCGPLGEGAYKPVVEEGDKGCCPISEQEEASPHHFQPMTVAESWEDLKRRSPSLAAACHRQEQQDTRRAMVWRIGQLAAAASIIIAISAGWVYLQNRPVDVTSASSSREFALPTDPAPAATLELVTQSGRQVLAMGEPIRTGDQPQEVLLGGMHRVVMNADTVATFATTTRAADKHLGLNGDATHLIRIIPILIGHRP